MTQHSLDILAVLLLVGLYTYWAYASFSTHSVFRSYDPEFDYFVTSLAPFKGMPYAYVDHPGTPVEVLGTAFIALSWPFVGGTPADLVDFYLRHPAVFFRIAYTFQLLAHLACSLYFYFTARSVGRIAGPLPVGLALLYYALDSSAVGTVTYWSHAAFSFPFGTLYLLVLFRIVLGSARSISRRHLIGLGFAGGFLTAIILYLAPWVVGTVAVVVVLYRLRGSRWGATLLAAGLVIVSAVVGFFIAIIPILWKWSSFWQWVLKLILNQGRFGNGEPGILSISTTITNLSGFMLQLPLVFIGFGISLLLWIGLWVAFRVGPRQRPAEWSMAIGLLLQILLLFLIVAKASFFFYLLPVLATLPVLAFVLLSLIPDKGVLRPLMGGLLLVAVSYQLILTAPQRWSRLQQLSSAISQDQSALQDALERAPQQLQVSPERINIVWTYGIFEHCNALLDGNYHAGFALEEEIAAFCPRQHFLPHGSESAFVNGERLALDEAASRGWIIVMRSAEADYILRLFPSATVQSIPSSSSSLGDIVLIYP